MNQVAKVKKAARAVRVRPMSKEVAEVRQSINTIHEALNSIMKKDTHFGTIPGCQKPTLYKAGAEVIIALFKLSTDPVVDNLSEGGEIRYQVKVNVTTREGVFVGSGIGECSSGEEKYMWRKAVSDKEFENTPETMKRVKYKPTYEINQVRVNPSDLANTILKMAKKRAMIDAVLTATGASDIFTQDIQDLPEGYIAPDEATGNETQKAEESMPEKEIVDSDRAKPTENEPSDPASEPKKGNNPISDPQRKRLFAIAMGAGIEKEEFKEWLFFTFNYESSKDIDRSDYEEICKAAEEYKK